MKNNLIRLVIISFASILIAGLSSCKKDDPEGTNEVSISELLGNNEGIEIIENPSGIAPLTASANYESNVPVKAKIKISGELPLLKEYSDYTSSRTIPILGLYADTTNQVEITLTAEDGRFAIVTFDITTDSLPEFMPEINIQNDITGMRESDMVLCNLFIDNQNNFKAYPFIFDANGEIRWYLNLTDLNSQAAPIEQLENGYLIIGSGNNAEEYNLLGEVMNTMNQSAYIFHHDIIELPNNNLAAAVSKTGSQVVIDGSNVNSKQDHMIELNRNTGAILQEWDLREILDVDRNTNTLDAGDWLHMNALVYSRHDDTYIISAKNQGILKTDRNNDLIWILAPHQDWGRSGWDGNGIFQCENYLLDAVDESGELYSEDIQNGNASDESFDWPWGQHAVKLLENGNILLFDNGANRTYGQATTQYSRAVEYEINASEKTVKQVWEFGKDRGEEAYSEIMGDVDLLPETGNRLLCFSGINYDASRYAKIIEVSYPDNMEIFEADIVFKNLNSGEVGDIIYRAESISLY